MLLSGLFFPLIRFFSVTVSHATENWTSIFPPGDQKTVSLNLPAAVCSSPLL